MNAQSINANILISLPDDAPDDAGEQIVKEALGNDPRIFLVEVTRTSVLFER